MPGPASRAMIPPRVWPWRAPSGTAASTVFLPRQVPVVGMENSREVRETQTHPVEAMRLGDSERDAAASSGHTRTDPQRDRLAARTDPWDGGPRTAPSPASESRSRNVAGRRQSSARYPSRSNWSPVGCSRRPVPAAIVSEDAPARGARRRRPRGCRGGCRSRDGLGSRGWGRSQVSSRPGHPGGTSAAMRANASATAPRRRSLRTTATLIVSSNVPASVRPEPGMVEELARRPGPHACGARPRPSLRTRPGSQYATGKGQKGPIDHSR